MTDALLSCLIVIGLNWSCLGLTEEDVLFYAPFEGKLDAVVARGSGAAAVTGSFGFSEGVRGQGVRVGQEGCSLGYEAKGNVMPERGTISIWVKPLNWNQEDAHPHIFWLARGDASYSLRKSRGLGNTYFGISTDKEGQSVASAVWRVTRYMKLRFEPGIWTHLCATWGPGCVAIYIDGKFVTSWTDMVVLGKTFKGEFLISPPDARAPEADTVIDELLIFRRQLDGSEAKALYEQGTKAPKIKESTVPPDSLLLPDVSPDLLKVIVRGLPSMEQIITSIDASAVSDVPSNGLDARIAVRKAGTKSILQEIEANGLPGGVHSVLLSSKDMRPGKYEVDVELTSEGKPLARRTAEYEKLPPPEWWRNTVGISSDVPPPWTPVKVDADRVSVWGRCYDFGRRLLPKQIITQDVELLAKPISLLMGGSDIADNAELKFVERKDDHILAEGISRAKGVEFNTRVLVEFDGMMWIDLSMEPAGGSSVGPLTLEIPFHSENATLQIPWDYKCKTTGAVPKEGFRVHFLPAIWVGNEAVGLQWFAESPSGWHVASNPIEIEPNGKTTILRIRLIGESIPLKEKRTLSFGMMATPVKPRRRPWRALRFGSGDLLDRGNVRYWWQSWAQLMGYPLPNKTAIERMAKEQEEKGWKRVCCYTNLSGTNIHSAEFKYYGEEWRLVPSARLQPSGTRKVSDFLYMCANARSWQDFYVYHLTKAIKEFDLQGLYYDVSSIVGCRNRYHGCGYISEGGELRPTHDIFALRNMTKRVYRFVKKRDPDFLIIYHMSGRVMMPYQSFCDVLFDGENFTSELKYDQPNYYRLLPLDTFRAEYMGHNLGPASLFLGELTRGLPNIKEESVFIKPTEHLIGMVLLHDSKIVPSHLPNQPMEHLWDVYDEINWDDSLVFHPYWKQNLCTADKDGIKVSVYTRPGAREAILVAFNNSDDPIKTRIKLDLKGLSLPDAGLTIREAYHGAHIGLRKNVLDTEIEARNFQLIVIRKE